MKRRGGATIISKGRSLKKANAALFADIERRYGVPAGPLLAIWGMETGFGANSGNRSVFAPLATLAYDCRRPDLFRDQLVAALKLVDEGILSSSSIGAMHGDQRMRRAHDALRPTNLTPCPRCNQTLRPHTVCANCGHYRDRMVIDVEAAEQEQS